MDLLAFIGFLCFIYILIRLTVPWFLDCDLRLALNEKFGKPIYSLEGQVVWIIGASSGIGEHLAYVLARAKCKLILSARRGNELQMVKRKCVEEYRVPENDVEVLELDICKTEHHQRMFNHVLTKFGKLDILVNNAGRSQRAEWENIELEVDKEMFHLNVFSIISLTRLVVKYFQQTGKGHVVVTSSLAGIIGAPFSATYTATKHALHGYFACLGMEKIEKNIDVTMVCPGPIQTNFLAECFTEKLNEKYGQQTEISKDKVSAERCATLMAIAIANKLHEVWISQPLPLQLTYLARYHPDISYYIFKILGPKFLQKLRDSKNTSATNTPQPQNTTPS